MLRGLIISWEKKTRKKNLRVGRERERGKGVVSPVSNTKTGNFSFCVNIIGKKWVQILLLYSLLWFVRTDRDYA